MPTGLYHTQEGDAGAHVVGQNFQFPIDKSIALEMMQRLNVGGTAISSIGDTGMFRDWSQDSNNLLEISSVQPVTTTLRIKYTSIPSYTAPQKVYQTSWSMITDRQGNGTFNFTWKFPIDLGFRYLLRLHFCEFEYDIEESDRTKFSIFVNEHVADAKVDVINWSGGNKVAVYRDYVVMMEGDRMEGKHNLLITYFPHNNEWIEHIDAILRGLEEGLCHRFSLSEVLSMTNNFDIELVIGSGGFGNVYKGFIDDGTTIFALKRLKSKSNQGADEFRTEIEMLSNLRHTHLVSLIGYCDERQEMILVYEYMEHGTLADHLYKLYAFGNGTICHLSWDQRVKVCIGAARGRDYLHTGTQRGIIHRNVKTTNILLDKDWVAKISDFGLCKEGSTSHSHSHVSTVVKGTFGYLDPEYFLTHRLTKKSDVYAFGVVLLEVLCGRPAVDLSLEEEQHSLAWWAQQCIKEEKRDQLIDPNLRDQISPQCLKVFTEVANKCLHKHPSGRPTMTDVVASLECMLASQEQPRNACTEEEEEEKGEEEVNVHGDFNQENYDDKNTQENDILPESTLSSKSTPVQYNDNTQNQKRSKKNLFQRGIEFLARGTATNKPTRQGISPTANNAPSSDESISAQGDTDMSYLDERILPTPNLRIFSFSKLRNATKNFGVDALLGEGRFGAVYRGTLYKNVVLNNGSGLNIVVKKLDNKRIHKFEDWQLIQSEVRFLGRLSHSNLVQLLGYCWEDDELLVVYEFMSRGSLETHLFGCDSAVEPLPWDIRLKILIGVARGLAFLQTLNRLDICRRFKASNISLDGSFNFKISDFSYAELDFPDSSVPDEYNDEGHLASDDQLPVRNDVYCFGVVLVEMLTGSRAPKRLWQRGSVGWVKPYLADRRKLIIIMDSRLKGKYPPEAALGIAHLALNCLEGSRSFVYASGVNAIATVFVILLTFLNITVYKLRVGGEKVGEKNISRLPPEGLCHRFSLSEVLLLTNNFDDELVIGSGGFDNVYIGLIDDGTTNVAMKRLNSKSKQGADAFRTEIEMFSNLWHMHLVSLIGYCDEWQEMILVYEYMEHGTIADHLYKRCNFVNGTICHLSWEQRMKICIGAAHGMDYLHTGTRRGIIHCDVKTTYILLDKDWVAKISNFGLRKVGTTSHSHSHVSTKVKGTFGYLDPEYFLTRRLTKKSDVYAFGVVLLEVLCGRPAVDMRLEEEQRSLALLAHNVSKRKNSINSLTKV
ncbi:hypothetical protein RHMOL_Rhmol10G0066600 [Rhododendron molle]|uniref:Uncharacterized protein n=1 Tax=Rhododendron molle TaxID=49168 RepID=A0ACC0LZR5_RHOML|nr:hypothetical protein RHMOL_Rhmol10G0066600 [Rhododendron molle]